jgi:hypothetical protein
VRNAFSTSTTGTIIWDRLNSRKIYTCSSPNCKPREEVLSASALCMEKRSCCTQVSPLPSRIHVSGLDNIWHMSFSLSTGNVVTFDTTDLKPTNGFGGLGVYPFWVTLDRLTVRVNFLGNYDRSNLCCGT